MIILYGSILNWKLYFEWVFISRQHWLELRGELTCWTFTLHIWGRHRIGFKVQACSRWVCCLFLPPFSLGRVVSEPQDDPLGPRRSPAAAVGLPPPWSCRPSVRGAHSRSGPSLRRGPGWGRRRRLGAELPQGGLGVRWRLLWLGAGADGRAWWSVPTPLPLR